MSVFSFQGTLEFLLEFVVGLSGLEPPTSRLSGGRSNRLSYKPEVQVASYFALIFSLFKVLSTDP